MAEYAKSARIRAGIVDACARVFRESGFHGTSMAQIARDAEVSYTGLLHHFPRKEQLLTAVLDVEDQRRAEFLRAHRTFSAEADPVQVLRELSTMLLDRKTEPGLIQLTAVLVGEATSTTHPAHQHFVERFTNIRSFMTRLFTSLHEQGRTSGPLTPAEMAAVTIATIDGLQTQWLFAQGEIDTEKLVRGVLSMLVPELAQDADRGE
ncbi:TetR/AcrR family transcriptional regulator [Pseudoclavibacter sp. VKM Ac-2867]|uniref:TetR/AcrR family transcriptional regulator n=1 Tax=Pseudoclavibacter sp. VKM Ac-2867 TaxID=2783829 RepID=UPI00188D404F|nr:TetR/AcrR family transcriptional regulator [Pseudoclavibacter sp. VKM Ac-2867]MBF4460114.1 TetR family transcriptional regulator [Pseudoclavibacter sp. VKM Ac-2867]